MKTVRFALAGAALATLVFVGAVAAAGPTPSPAGRQMGDGDTIPALLGLSQAEVMQLRHDGLSPAQIAERQKVDPQKLIDALVAQWSERIDARVAAGALTATEAATLRQQLPVQAKAMVNQVTMGGMRGAAVGAGPGSGGMGAGTGATMGAGMNRGMRRGAGSGTGTCDATGPHGRTTP